MLVLGRRNISDECLSGEKVNIEILENEMCEMQGHATDSYELLRK